MVESNPAIASANNNDEYPPVETVYKFKHLSDIHSMCLGQDKSETFEHQADALNHCPTAPQ
jgi:hypothetical protein